MSDTKNEFDEDELCNLFTDKNTVTSKSNLQLFLELSGFDEKKPDEYKIVSVNKFKGEYYNLKLGNGGSWCRNSAWKHHKVATMKKNGIINYLWETDDEKEQNIVKEAFDKYPITKGNTIQYIGIFGLKEQNKLRPIRNDIKSYWSKFPCLVCGLKQSLVCDHKNDLYNDTRVLNMATQTIDDFQSLCNKCNLIKRQVSKDTIKTKKRYGATNIPFLKIFGIDFIEGDETFNPDDVNAMKGTFWYDPMAFTEGLRNILKKN